MKHAVAQLVEALRFKPNCRRFVSRWCNWSFTLTWSFRSHYGPGVDSASNRNEYQEFLQSGKGGRCVGLTTLPPSCVDCHEIREHQPPGTLRACIGIALPFFYRLCIETDYRRIRCSKSLYLRGNQNSFVHLLNSNNKADC